MSNKKTRTMSMNKTKFADTIDSFFPNTKKKIKTALSIIPRNDPAISGTNQKEIPEVTSEIKELISNFQNFHEKNMVKYNFQKEENDKFQSEINKTLKFEKYILKKKNPYNGENAKRDEAFRDIIAYYKEKGLKIPNLTTNKNLFKPSALLIEESELKQYFQIKKGDKSNKGFEEKETYFISKVNNLLYKRVQELDSKVDNKKIKRNNNTDNLESNIYQSNLMGISNAKNEDEFSHLNLRDLRENIHKLKSQNEDIKENIIKFQENANDNNDTDNDNKIKRCNSPKKNKKPKIPYQEFLNRLAKPKTNKSLGLNLIEVKKDPESKILLAVENLLGEKNNPYKPIMQSATGKLMKDGDVYTNYLNKIKKGINLNILRKTNSNFSNFGDKDRKKISKSMNFTSRNRNSVNTNYENSYSLNINNISNKNFMTKGTNYSNNFDENKNDYDKEKEKFKSSNEFLNDKEKLQEAIEANLKSKDINNEEFKELMIAYAKKYSHFEEKHIEELINTRRVEAKHLMKGIGDIKHKIDYLDLKETYLDSFLSIGKFDQGATLMKIKGLDGKINKLDLGLMKSVLKIDN